MSRLHTAHTHDDKGDRRQIFVGDDGELATRQGHASPRDVQRSASTVSPFGARTFTERLARLFEDVHPPGRRRYTNIEVVQELSSRGHNISTSYLSQLRTGQRTRPSVTTVCALAEFFRVRPEYFTNDDIAYTELMDAELRWLHLAHDPSIRRLTTALMLLPPHRREDLLHALHSAC